MKSTITDNPSQICLEQGAVQLACYNSTDLPLVAKIRRAYKDYEEFRDLEYESATQVGMSQ